MIVSCLSCLDTGLTTTTTTKVQSADTFFFIIMLGACPLQIIHFYHQQRQKGIHTVPELWALSSLTDDDDVEFNVLGCRVDILGTNCDQCVCMVQCCLTSTETIMLIWTGSPGQPLRLSHSSWTLMESHRPILSRYIQGQFMKVIYIYRICNKSRNHVFLNNALA